MFSEPRVVQRHSWCRTAFSGTLSVAHSLPEGCYGGCGRIRAHKSALRVLFARVEWTSRLDGADVHGPSMRSAGRIVWFPS